MLLHGMHHLWEQLEDWLKLHSAWQLTETSSLGAGFAVLSRRRDGFDGAQSTKSSNCSWSLWAQIMRKATTLLEAKGEFFFCFKYGYWGWPRGPNKRIDIWRGPPAKFLKNFKKCTHSVCYPVDKVSRCWFQALWELSLSEISEHLSWTNTFEMGCFRNTWGTMTCRFSFRQMG